ncbi:hypothetical protein DFR50_108165 [Roseiarcus fermentans]|uniref:DUF6460 domain-containing protein n=1 Tax=Roseiarcus fermentans TaxID=1473586 RepID=A0A366FLT5_9HYPH|nr:DUF6460 domain-containing protein [Roseiarcus fermentans]RBP15608.1 hypothetical protein DFR50_108165 [Roseiarcus fermentans]
MSNSFVARFVGGSPMAVVLRLVVVSFVVGFLLDAFGLDPANLVGEVVRSARHVFEYGFANLREFGRMFLTGAMVVVPVWIVLRLLDAGRGR